MSLTSITKKQLQIKLCVSQETEINDAKILVKHGYSAETSKSLLILLQEIMIKR